MIWLRNTFISIATISFRSNFAWSICSIFRFRLLAVGVWLSRTILLESSIEQITKSEWAHFHRKRACDLVFFSHGSFKSYCSSAHFSTFSLSIFRSLNWERVYFSFSSVYVTVLFFVYFVFIHFDVESNRILFIHDTTTNISLRLPICNPNTNLQRIKKLLIKVCPSVNSVSTIKSWWRPKDVQASLVTMKRKHRHVRANRW